MTSRRTNSNANPVGISSRQDLFQPTSRINNTITTNRNNNNNYNDNNNDQQIDYDLQTDKNSPLQLERLIGYSGNFTNTVVSSTVDDSQFFRSLGCLVSVESLSDSTSQFFFRGHDMNVSALCVSPSGRLVVSGQVGTGHYKGFAAPAFVWDVRSGRRISVLRGLTVSVNRLAFSHDEQYICGCGEDSQLYIWETLSSEVVYSHRLPSPVSALSWIYTDSQPANNGSVQYELVLGYGNGLYKCILSYDATRVQWSARYIAYTQPPSASLVRTFTAVAVSPDSASVFVGTTAGEMLVFRRDSGVFRASISTCAHGVQSLLVDSNGDVICGGGDGTIRRLSGFDMQWKIVAEGRVDGAVRSLSLTANGLELIVCSSIGSLYRCMYKNLIHTVITSSPTNPVTCICFTNDSNSNTTSSPYVATGSVNGEIRIFDMTDCACLAITTIAKAGAIRSLAFIKNQSIVSGFDDGTIRCHDSSLTRQLWVIPSSHRDGVSSLFIHISNNIECLVSGGADGAVRVWKLSSREMLTQYTEHKKRVARVLIDVSQHNIVHSAGADGTIVSFDIKSGRRIVSHILKEGVIHDLTQRRDHERELVTVDSLGRIMQWDIDYANSVSMQQDSSTSPLRSCEISPTGRYMAIGGDDSQVKIIDVESNQIIAVGVAHSEKIISVKWTPDERQLVACSSDNCLSIWNFYLGGQLVS